MQELTQIVKQHPESVAFVFSKYGHPNLPINIPSLKAMSVKYGISFLEDLSDHIASEESVSTFNGLNPFFNQVQQRGPLLLPQPNVSQPKKQKFFDVLERGLGIFFDAKNKNVQQQQKQQQVIVEQRQSNTKWIVIGGVVVLALLALFIFGNKKIIK